MSDEKKVVVAFICGGKKLKACIVCNARAEVLCDFKLTGCKAGQTCDRPLCTKHAVRFGALDCCAAHAEMLKKGQVGT